MAEEDFLLNFSLVQGVEKVERTLHSGRAVGDLSFFFGMRHLGKTEMNSYRQSCSDNGLALMQLHAKDIKLLVLFASDYLGSVSFLFLRSLCACSTEEHRFFVATIMPYD